MTVVSSYKPYKWSLVERMLCRDEIGDSGRKTQYLPRKRQKHKHSSNMNSSKGQLRELTTSKVCLRSSSQVIHPNRASLIWCTEWATLIDSLTALWISSGYPVCEWGLHLRYPESTRFFGGQKMKNWSYNFRMSVLCFLLLILACSCGEKSIGLILQEK